MTTATATGTTTFYFDLEASSTLEVEAPVGTDPEVIRKAVFIQLCIDNRIDLPEGISLDCADMDIDRLDFVGHD